MLTDYHMTLNRAGIPVWRPAQPVIGKEDEHQTALTNWARMMRTQYQALVAEKDKNSGDTAETYTTGYRYGHRNGQIELLQQILGIFDGVSKPEEANE